MVYMRCVCQGTLRSMPASIARCKRTLLKYTCLFRSLEAQKNAMVKTHRASIRQLRETDAFDLLFVRSLHNMEYVRMMDRLTLMLARYNAAKAKYERAVVARRQRGARRGARGAARRGARRV
jgi:hypothetical protein